MNKSTKLLANAAIQLLLAVSACIPAAALVRLEGTLSDTLSIEKAVISSSFSNEQNSPLRLSRVSGDDLRRAASTYSTYPELLKGIPGIYAVSETGSHGDARLNMRGFAQENIAILLNGIPISGLTSGNMYWNNWMGLSEATSAIQVQKGIGASMLADGSVGGSVNIVTTIPAERRRISLSYLTTDYGTMREALNYDSGQLPHGWNIHLMAAYTHGKGYVNSTDISSASYLLTISKTLGDYNSLYFTALGSPERHAQRSTRLSAAEVEKYGRAYNKNWGYRDGKPFNLSRNHYFKPYFTLQHFYEKDRLKLANSVYLAVASGGGRWNEAKGTPLSGYIGTDGQIDFAAAAADASSIHIMSDYMAGHTQFGAILSGEYKAGAYTTLAAGAHYQLYDTWEYEQITDLLGNDYWYEEWGDNPYKKVGDRIRTNNGKKTHVGTIYFKSTRVKGKLSATLGFSLFGSSTKRWDRYRYTGDEVWSEDANGFGGNIKGGVLYQPTPANRLYINAGAYDRLPYPGTWFASGDNTITRDVKNEKDFLSEAGWRHTFGRGYFELSAYAAERRDKSLMSNTYKIADKDSQRYMISGLGARHFGAEFEGRYKPLNWLEISAAASLGDWRWTGNVEADIYDRYSGDRIQTLTVYCDGLPVADAPQTQVQASARIELPAGIYLRAGWNFTDRMYANFEPSTRTAKDAPWAYRIPSRHVFDAAAEWKKDFGRIDATVFLSCTNLTDATFIENGKDGASHDLDSFRGYWGFGRVFSFGIKLGFD